MKTEKRSDSSRQHPGWTNRQPPLRAREHTFSGFALSEIVGTILAVGFFIIGWRVGIKIAAGMQYIPAKVPKNLFALAFGVLAVTVLVASCMGVGFLQQWWRSRRNRRDVEGR